MRDCRSADVQDVPGAAGDRTEPTDHYDLLGVTRDASVEEIILGYRLLVRTILSHPELTGGDWNLGLAEQALHILSHADLRADYDRRLAEAEGRRRQAVEPPAYLTSVAPTTALVLHRAVPDRGSRGLGALPDPTRALVKRESAPPVPALAGPSEPSEPSAEERRALLRLRREGTIRGRLTDGRTFVASLHDVSPKGLGFETTLPLEVGAEVWLKSDALFATAVVRNLRASPRDPAQHVVGVEFQRVHFRSTRGTFLSTTA